MPALLPIGGAHAAEQASEALRITISDGASLAATLTGPAPLVSRPTIVELTPYGQPGAAGHRIQLSLVGQSALSFPALPSLNTAMIGGDSGSRLMFPTVPGSDLADALP